MPWVFHKRSTAPRKQSHDEEILDAIKRARLDGGLPQNEFVQIEMIATIGPKYWGVTKNGFSLYMRQRMDPKIREELKIEAPRRNKAVYA